MSPDDGGEKKDALVDDEKKGDVIVGWSNHVCILDHKNVVGECWGDPSHSLRCDEDDDDEDANKKRSIDDFKWRKWHLKVNVEGGIIYLLMTKD